MRRWLLCVLVCAACGKSERKPAPWFDELARAPIEISDVTVKQGAVPEAGHYLRVDFTVHGIRPITDRPALMVRAACRIGDLVMTSTTAPRIELHDLAVADTRRLEALPFAVNGFVGTADPCELGFFLDRGARPSRFQTFCWSAGAVADGPCAALSPTPGGAPFQLASAELALHEGHLVVAATISVGQPSAGDAQLALNTRCEIAGQVVSAEAPTVASFAYLSPGESLRVTGAVPAVSPTWCELAIVIRPALELGKRCLRDGKVSDGGC